MKSRAPSLSSASRFALLAALPLTVAGIAPGEAKALEQLQRAQAINRQGQLASKQQAQSYQDERNGALKQNVKDENNK